MSRTVVHRSALPLLVLVLLALAVAAPRLSAAPRPTATGPQYVQTRESSPARTVVRDGAGAWIATFTDGARTVTLRGAARTFAERTAVSVATDTWVRLLARPFAGTVDLAWLEAARADRSADILALAAQYIEGSPDVVVDGTRVAGDADYGPLQPDGTRQEGSDFNDFLGVSRTYGDKIDAPETAQFGALDCSGFMRMIWGYRSGLPLGLAPDGGASLPRRAFEMYAAAPGVVTVANRGGIPAVSAPLAAGDLVFFDVATDDGTQLDHVGMYLGKDAAGERRFISSRKSINGPTLGDFGGRSVLDGTGLYAKGFRAVRRL